MVFQKVKNIKMLISPSNLTKKIKENKIEIKGTIALYFAWLLEIMIMIPLFIIIFIKVFLEGRAGDFGTIITDSLVITVFVLVFVPIISLSIDSFFIFLSLKIFKSPVSYIRVFFSRTIGLIPFVILLPLKALLSSPYTFVASFFWPPLTGLIVTLTNDSISYPDQLNALALTISTVTILKIGLTLIILIWTFSRTSKTLAKIGDIPKSKAYYANLIQIILSDMISLLIALSLSLAFS